MLQKISSLNGINKEVILFDSPDEQKANQFSVLDIEDDIIRVIETGTKTRLQVFLINNLLSDDWWIPA